jgi:basic amino acid/polyamine antiporter, APA family
MTDPAPAPQPREELVRAIGRWSMALLTINCMIGSGVFGLPSAITGKVGRASVPAVLLAGAVVAVIMACFAEVSSRFTGSGGPYLYVRTAFGRLLGIEVAWLVWLVRLTACAANVNLFSTYLGEFWPSATQPLPRILILTLLVSLLAGVNYRGVRVGTRVSNFFSTAKLLTLCGVCAVGGYYLVATHPTLPLLTVTPHTNEWVSSIVLLIFAYGGFEASLISTGEAKNPRRDAVFGLFAALVTCTVIYALIQWVVVGLLPDAAHSERPLADVARLAIGHTGAALVSVGALLSIYGYLTGNILATPRMTFALAQQGDFPALFGAVHPRFRTPYVSIFVFAGLVWLLALLGTFAGNATLSAGARLVYYALVCASLPALRRKQQKAALFHLPGGLVFAVLGVLICLGMLTQIDLSKSLLLVATVGVGFLNWLAVRKRKTIAAPVS